MGGKQTAVGTMAKFGIGETWIPGLGCASDIRRKMRLQGTWLRRAISETAICMFTFGPDHPETLSETVMCITVFSHTVHRPMAYDILLTHPCL